MDHKTMIFLAKSFLVKFVENLVTFPCSRVGIEVINCMFNLDFFQYFLFVKNEKKKVFYQINLIFSPFYIYAMFKDF